MYAPGGPALPGLPGGPGGPVSPVMPTPAIRMRHAEIRVYLTAWEGSMLFKLLWKGVTSVL